MTQVVEPEGHGDWVAVRSELRAWHTSSWLGPVVEFTAVFGFWVMALVVGLWSEDGFVRALMALPALAAVGQLFTMGHDAGHGSFSTSRLVNGVVGRVAFVPSAHVLGLWRFHHDVHHRYTCLRGSDYVWVPLTVAEYRALSPWRRILHRFYRHRSGIGLSLHYAIEIWAPRMLWPRVCHGLRARGRLLADTVFLYAALAALAGLAWAFVAVVHPERSADIGFWLLAGVWLFVVPLVAAHWMIGFVIYLNHTHPDVVWYDDPTEWARHRVQLEGSVGVRFS
ncbi:MAG: hypothetical protein GY925_18955, partial [Actinomycetia bacterium]|nr:hypothetical protein [Actinomycetes bacterium]